MTALEHLTRLRTLTIQCEEAVRDDSQSAMRLDAYPSLAVLPTPAPPPLRHLIIDAGDCKVHVPCPKLMPGATVRLVTSSRLYLADAPAHLVGCRLEVHTPAVQIAIQGKHSGGSPHGGSADLMHHLFCWFKECGADCVVLLPHREPESDKRLPPVPFHLELDSGEEQWYRLEVDQDGMSEYERKLQLHSVRHGFLFAQSEHDGSVVFTRAA